MKIVLANKYVLSFERALGIEQITFSPPEVRFTQIILKSFLKTMIKNYFKIALRNLIKRKFYSAINIFGLSLGIACSIFLYLFISYHLSFDRYHKNASSNLQGFKRIVFWKNAS